MILLLSNAANTCSQTKPINRMNHTKYATKFKFIQKLYKQSRNSSSMTQIQHIRCEAANGGVDARHSPSTSCEKRSGGIKKYRNCFLNSRRYIYTRSSGTSPRRKGSVVEQVWPANTPTRNYYYASRRCCHMYGKFDANRKFFRYVDYH